MRKVIRPKGRCGHIKVMPAGWRREAKGETRKESERGRRAETRTRIRDAQSKCLVIELGLMQSTHSSEAERGSQRLL